MSTTQILIAGFGGQGVLFAGKFLAYKGLCEGRQVSWLPSYGPEMRGGTANCSVTLSDEPIGSPIITRPDILIAMNLPSLDKYEDAVKPGGQIYVDSSLIEREIGRNDVSVYRIPATRMASRFGTDHPRQYDYHGQIARFLRRRLQRRYRGRAEEGRFREARRSP